MSKKYDVFHRKLHQQTRHRVRKPIVPINGAHLLYEDQKKLSFCAHDYLALADHSDVKKSAIKFVLQYGLGITANERSELYLNCQKDVEEKFAALIGKPSSLFFPSREQANLITLSTIASADSFIFIDEACHPSLFHAGLKNHAHIKGYKHQRLDQLEYLLEEHQGVSKIIISESVFSQSGDLCNLSALVALAEQYDALLYIDDAHSFGIMGHEGMGLCAHVKGIDIISGSFNKAAGVGGGYIACSSLIHDFLVHFSSYLGSQCLPSPLLGGIDAILDLLPQMEGERKQLEQKSHFLRKQLKDLGFEVSFSSSPLISLLFNTEEEMEDLKELLKQADMLTAAGRGIPSDNGLFRLPIVVTISHMPDHLNQLVGTIRSWKEALLMT